MAPAKRQGEKGSEAYPAPGFERRDQRRRPSLSMRLRYRASSFFLT
jgi:hypothetical protein